LQWAGNGIPEGAHDSINVARYTNILVPIREINAPVRFAVEKEDCYLLDEEGKEHKLVVEKKILKPKESQQ
jgi:hypothetical protein